MSFRRNQTTRRNRAAEKAAAIDRAVSCALCAMKGRPLEPVDPRTPPADLALLEERLDAEFLAKLDVECLDARRRILAADVQLHEIPAFVRDYVRDYIVRRQ